MTREQAIFSGCEWILAERAVLLPEAHHRALMGRISENLKAGRSPAAGGFPANAAGDGNPLIAPRQGMVACIQIYGVLNKDYDWCGMVSTVRLMDQLQEALADDSVSAIVLDIDSPGGFVNGTVEFADAVAEANAIKPVTAVVRGLCCSGAYWIASQCGKIVSRPESQVGNIGVYQVLMDVSAFFAQFGITLTTVASGQFKGLGADGKVTDDLINDTRRTVTGLYGQFVDAVAAGRKLDAEAAAKLSDGKAYLGPQAKQLGLVDAVAKSLGQAIQIATGATAPESETSAMANAANATATQPGASTAPPAATAANPAPKAGAGGDDKSTSNEKARKVLQSTIDSATAHKTQVRAALDHAQDMGDDPDDATKSLARKAAASIDATSDEAKRASKAWLSKAGDAPPPGDGKSPDNGDGDGDENKSQNAAAYLAAFGDAGAKLFLEGKPFNVAAGEFITGLKAAHKTETDALKAENAELKKKLAAMPRGNEEARASLPAEGVKQGPGANTAANGLTPNLARFAASLKAPGKN